MTEQELRPVVARNIAACRRQAGLTQAELAERMNYSDKTISKWERAEGMPDLAAACRLAEIFRIPVDALLQNETPSPEDDAALLWQANRKRQLTLLLSVGLCYLAATVAFFLLRVAVPDLEKTWLAFVYALPCSMTVCVVFACLWWGRRWQLLAVSGLIWALAVSVDLSLRVPRMYLIYVVAAAVQVLFLLWYRLLAVKKMTGARK